MQTEMLREEFERLADRVASLREECEKAGAGDSFVLGTFEHIRDELVAVEVYMEEFAVCPA